MTDPIDNYADIIDSRDVINRIEELEEEVRVEWHERNPGRDDEDPLDFGLEAHNYLDYDEATELNALRELRDEASQYAADWEYGETLIRSSYFTDYCAAMLDDCGYLPADLPAFIVVDWERTADNLKVDYTEVEFAGVTYFIR